MAIIGTTLLASGFERYVPLVGKLAWPAAIIMLICGILVLFPYRQVAFAGLGVANSRSLKQRVILSTSRSRRR